MSHYTEHDVQPEIRMFPALKLMERQTPPVRYNRPPYWRPPVPAAAEQVYIPTWNWTFPGDLTEDEPVTVLDVNAAYLSALGGVKVGHSHLQQTGRLAHLPALREVAPGYYKITIPYWAFDYTLVHPLGDSARVTTEDSLWIAAPTLVLLLELIEANALGHFDIIDSYTAAAVTDFRTWSERLRSLRNERLDAIDTAQTEVRRREMLDRYDAFKQGYSAALSLMLTGEKCLTRRPDWAHAIYAQHAASTWRKAWKFTFTGHPVVAMGAVDEISIFSAHLADALMLPKPPFRYDATGRQVGALKPKKVTFVGAEPVQRGADVPVIDEDDIL